MLFRWWAAFRVSVPVWWWGMSIMSPSGALDYYHNRRNYRGNIFLFFALAWALVQQKPKFRPYLTETLNQ